LSASTTTWSDSAPDALGLVLGADEKLVDADSPLAALERHIAGRSTSHLGDEDRLALENAERALVRPAIEARQPE
jgi:hypothetical protein